MLLTNIEYPHFFNRPYRFLLAPFGVKKETMAFRSVLFTILSIFKSFLDIF